MVISACEAVPLVKDVEIHLIENDTSKEIGLEELAMLDIKVKSDEVAEQEKWAAEEETGFDIPPEMKKKLMENLLKKLMA